MFQMAVGFLIYGNHIGTAGKTKFEQIVVHLAAWHGSTRFVHGVCLVQNVFLQNPEPPRECMATERKYRDLWTSEQGAKVRPFHKYL